MKKNILFLFFAIYSFTLFAQTDEQTIVPYLLNGIWYNQERYIVFNTQFTSDQVQEDKSVKKAEVPQIVLRTFYTWYNDRAAESLEYTNLTQSKNKNTSHDYLTDDDPPLLIPQTARDRNNTTALSAEEIKITFLPIDFELYPENYKNDIELEENISLRANELPSGAWLMKIQFDKSRDIYFIPVAVIGNNLYLNFLVRQINLSDFPDDSEDESFESEKNLEGFWQDYGSVLDIQIRKPVLNKELLSYYVASDAIYPLRYWKTDMDYNSEAKAYIEDGTNTFEVPKHLKIGEQVYTCVVGRRTKIRNLKKIQSFDEYTQNSVLIIRKKTDSDGKENLYTNKMATIIAFGKPYLSLTDGKKTIEELVVEANQRHKPLPAPLFPPHGILDFHWEEIRKLPAQTYNRVLSIGKN